MAIRLNQTQAHALAYTIQRRIKDKLDSTTKQLRASQQFARARKDLRKQYPSLEGMYKLQEQLKKLKPLIEQVSADAVASFLTMRELATSRDVLVSKYHNFREIGSGVKGLQERIDEFEEQALALHFNLGNGAVPTEEHLYNELIIGTIDPSKDIEEFIESLVTKYTTRV